MRLRSTKRVKVSQRHTGKPRQSAFGLSPYHRRLDVEELEDRRLLDGLTLITHGFGDNASGWVTSMANQVVAEIASRFDCDVTDVAEIKLTVNSDLTVTPSWIPGHHPDFTNWLSPCSETVVLLDWSAVAGNWFSATTGIGTISSTVDVAAAVAPCLYEPLPVLGLNAPLAQGPIQLIGHSRGGSLVGELAKDLGKQGLWVDQVTTLDPHPLTNTGLDWALVPGVTDAPMTAWNNVVFWDNYWETTYLYPHGEWIPGACNDAGGNYGNVSADVPLTFPSDGYPTTDAGSHNDVHLWYQGTINTEAIAAGGGTVSDGSYSFNAQTDGWYSGSNPPETTSGYYFSRIDGGDRTSSAASDGLLWDDAGARTSVSLIVPIASAWENVEITSLPQNICLNQGTSLPLSLEYEAFGNTQITVGFDTDANPYNGAPNALQWQVSANASNGAAFSPTSTTLSTTGLTPGDTYYVYAEITNGGNTRYYYATGAVYVNPALPAPSPHPHVTTVSPPTLPGLPLPQTQLLTINGSGFTSTSVLQFFDGTTTYSDRVPTYVSPNQLTYNIKVGEVTANWTVTVINTDGWQSNPGSFNVQASGNTTAPGAPIGLTATLLNPSVNSFSVSWTDPSDPYGFGEVWWKLGSAPTSNTDGYSADLPASMPLCVYNLSQQAVTLYVWLEDGADNVNYQNFASVTLPGNSNLPVVAITSPTSGGTYATSNPILSLSGTVTDSSGTIEAMAWNDSLGGNGAFFNSGNTWAAPPIQLLPGVNTIFVGAIDNKSSIGATPIAVTYTPAASFAASQAFDTGDGPTDVAVGDFNGDGRPDMAIVNGYDQTVSVLLNNGNGTFAPKIDYSVPDTAGSGPVTLVVADVYGNGKQDLVIAGFSQAVICALPGNGDGTFGAPINYATGLYDVESVTVADVNGDGKPDLLVTGSTTTWNEVVSVLLNKGNGTFGARTDYLTGTFSLPESVVAKDFNGDGKPDLAVVCRGSDTIRVFLNTGNGTFGAGTDYAVGSDPYSVAVGDFNGDGKADLAVANDWDNTVTVLLNTGNGVFSPAATYPTGASPLWISATDLNGDGMPDLITANYGDNTISVLLNKGNGTFAAATAYPTGSAPDSVVGADFNGDGKTDLAVTNRSDNTVSILLGTPQASVAVTSSADPSTYGQTMTLTATVSAVTPASGTPTGTVTFHDGATAISAPITLTSGTATFTTSGLSVGLHAITAVFSGDTNFTGNTGEMFQTVNKATMKVTPANWTTAGLTLALDGNVPPNLQVYKTGTPTNVVTSCPLADVSNIQIASPSTAGYNLTIDSTAGNPIPAGGLTYSGAGKLTKIGSGTLTLSGTNTFSGGIAVSAGTLIVAGPSALPNGTSLIVGAGGIFVFDPSSSAGPSDTTILPNDTPVATSSDMGTMSVLPISTSVVPASPVLLTPTVAEVADSATVAIPPVTLPLLAFASAPQTKSLGKSVLASPSHVNRTVWSSTAKGFAAYPVWLEQAANNSDTSNQQRKKDVAILALDAVFADLGDRS